MKTFEDLVFENRNDEIGWIWVKMFFDNWYWVSVVKWYWSYGYEEGLYELWVVKWTEQESSLCYDTPITDDVIGYLTPAKITSIMKQVQRLPAVTV